MSLRRGCDPMPGPLGHPTLMLSWAPVFPHTDTQSSGVLCDWPQKRGFPEAQNTPKSNFLPFVGKIIRKRELGIFFGISRVFKEMLFSERHLVRNLAGKLTPPNFSGPFLHHLWELPAVLSSMELELNRCPSIRRRDTTLEELPVRIHKFLWLHKETDDKIEDQNHTEMTLTTSITIITVIHTWNNKWKHYKSMLSFKA